MTTPMTKTAVEPVRIGRRKPGATVLTSAETAAQLRRASATDQQGAAEFFLQAANLLGQRGLTEVEKAGSPLEMKLSGENQERTYLRDIHSI
jgi:hypothetical protein